MTEYVLALNAGSSSVKFGLFKGEATEDPALILRGTLEDGGAAPKFAAVDAAGVTVEERHWSNAAPREDLFRSILELVDGYTGGTPLAGVGHRIVHGGARFSQPIRLTEDIVAALDALTPLAPLHQPRSLEPVRALMKMHPELCQIGCFDTAFHHDLEPPVTRYAIPFRFEAEGVRKYGFHGLSYESIVGSLERLDPTLLSKRIIVAHLGNGASLCAIRDGRSVDTTMGFSALDGLMMGTRCGAIDPGVLLYLQKEHRMSVEALEQMLYRESGLLGVSGVSADIRELSTSDDPRAKDAVALFTFRIAREVASMASTLGGVDVIVFTGGIGQHAPAVRSAVCDRLAWIGVVLNAEANALSSLRCHASVSRAEIYVIPTDEEFMIAHHTRRVSISAEN